MSEPIHDCESNSAVASGRKEAAKQRWKILAGAIQKNAKTHAPPYYSPGTSKQRYLSFDIFTSERIGKRMSGPMNWFKYTTIVSDRPRSIKICSPILNFTPNDLIKFDNSGNICIWPSEEILAYYSLCNIEMFTGKSVLELGGGMTCLAGLMIAKYSKATKVELTDGNDTSIQNIYNILCCNGLKEDNRIQCSVLKWGDHKEHFCDQSLKYDIVILADCLYIHEERQNLVDVIWKALSERGIVLIFAPQRGNTLKAFMTQAGMKGFNYVLTMNYNDYIWKKHLALKNNCKYNENKDYPLLLILTKPNDTFFDIVK